MGISREKALQAWNAVNSKRLYREAGEISLLLLGVCLGRDSSYALHTVKGRTRLQIFQMLH